MSPQEACILKEDLKNVKDEIIYEFHRYAEIISGDLKLLAQGISTLNEKIEKFRQELKDELENKTHPILRRCEIGRLQL